MSSSLSHHDITFAYSSSVRALSSRRLIAKARASLCSIVFSLEEFANVISWWDKLDDNRERRERYHEIGRSEVPLEWHASDYILPGNANYDMVLWQQILAGDFIDYIFDEPDYIHELVRSQDLCLILKNMKEHQKQLLYYVVVRSYSTLQYSELNGKTDRNVRGVRETAIKQIRKKYKTALETSLLHLPWTLTLDEKYFLENGVRTKDEKNSEKQ